MSSYFGLCDAAGDPTEATALTNAAAGVVWIGNNPGTHVFTCPGAGNQTVTELSAMVHKDAGAPNLRLAVYNTAGNVKLCEGAAQVAIAGAADAWQGHMAQANISPNPVTLVGGTAYLIVVGFDATTAATTHGDASNTSGVYGLDDYTGGYPAALAADGQTYCWPVRCKVGVDPVTYFATGDAVAVGNVACIIQTQIIRAAVAVGVPLESETVTYVAAVAAAIATVLATSVQVYIAAPVAGVFDYILHYRRRKHRG